MTRAALIAALLALAGCGIKAAPKTPGGGPSPVEAPARPQADLPTG